MVGISALYYFTHLGEEENISSSDFFPKVLLEVFICMSTVSYLQWVFLAHLFTHRMVPLYESIKLTHPCPTAPLKWTSKTGKTDELCMPVDYDDFFF